MTTDRVVTFDVCGVPQPKGSARSFVPKAWAEAAVAAGRSPRAVVTSANPKLKEWQTAVAQAAQPFAVEGLFVGPVAVALVFRLQRPKSAPRRVVHHVTKPDVDKLARACLDGLKGVLYRDDANVVTLRARKVFAIESAALGVEITVGAAAPPEYAQGSLTLFEEP